MKERVYVFGHRNPDTDSVCSAIAYANLKTLTDDSHEYKPAILGGISKETEYVLEHLDLKVPKIIGHLKSQVSDLTLDRADYVNEKSSIGETLGTIVGQAGRTLPVVGQYNNLIGVVSISDILPMYMAVAQQAFLKDHETPFSNIIKGLELNRLYGDEPKGEIEGKVVLLDDLHKNERLEPQDIVICDIEAYEAGRLKECTAGYLIIGNVLEDVTIKETDDLRVVFTTTRPVYSIVRRIFETAPIRKAVTKSQLEYFTTYETLEDVKKNMATSKFRRFPVVDEVGQIVGMMSRSNLLNTNKKKAILVDHNEKGQSIEGIDHVNILEVIDHHRVADIQTIGPLYFRVEPVGCTCTIISKMYEEANVEISQQMAQLMLSAILSDTLIFKSPTSTQEDRRIATKLSQIAKIDMETYGMSMIYAGSALEHATPKSILTTDMKRFTFGNRKVMIAQTNTSDFDGFFGMYDEMMVYMNKLIEKEHADLFVLLVTDVIVGGTEVVAQGESKWIVDEAFGMSPKENSIFLPGVFSRKKQVVPRLMQAASL